MSTSTLAAVVAGGAGDATPLELRILFGGYPG